MGEIEGEVRELRLAVSMVGGSSLAVHIHGTAQELEAFARAEGLYGSLARLTRTKPVIDILSGTSAGGINSVLLATALTNGTKMKVAEAVFKEEADMDVLLRRIGFSEDGGPSILRGNAVLLKSLKDVFKKLLTSQECESTVENIDLFVTGTFLQGFPQTYFGDAGTRIYSKQHQGVFHFRRHDGRNDFCRSANGSAADLLAKAARTTASLPAIFEVSDVSPEQFELPDSASGTPIIELPALTKVWMGDGGYLNVRPLDLVIKSIARKPVQKLPVDRRVVLVEPTPDSLDIVEEDLLGPDPLKHVQLFASISMSQSLHGLLEQADYHNRNVQKVQRALDVAKESFRKYKLEEKEPQISEQQLGLFVSTSAEAIAARLKDTWAARMGIHGKDLVGGAKPALKHQQRRELSNKLEEFCRLFEDKVLHRLKTAHLEALRGGAVERNLRQYDVLALERKIVWLIDDLYQTFENLSEEARESQAWESIFSKAYLLFELAQKLLRKAVRDYGKAVALNERGEWAFDHLVFEKEIDLDQADWERLKKEFGREFRAEREVERLEQYLNYLFTSSLTLDLGQQTGLVLAPEKPADLEDASLFSTYLQWLDIHLFPIQYAAEVQFHQPLKIAMIDPFEKLGLSGLVKPEDKVAGDTLMKFGGFLRHTWRVNDIIWGRIDASSKLIKLMMDREFLQKTYDSKPNELWAEVAQELGLNEETPLKDGSLAKHLTGLPEYKAAAKWNESEDNWWALCHVLATHHHLTIVRESLPELLASDLWESAKMMCPSKAEEILGEELKVPAIRNGAQLRKPEEIAKDLRSEVDELKTQKLIDIFRGLNFGGQTAADIPRKLNVQRGLRFAWSTFKTMRHSKGQFPVNHFHKLFRPIEFALVSLSKMIANPVSFGLGSLFLFLILVAWTACCPTWPIRDGQPLVWTLPAGLVLMFYVLVSGVVVTPKKPRTPKWWEVAILGLLLALTSYTGYQTNITKPVFERGVPDRHAEHFTPDGWPGTGIVPFQFVGNRERAAALVDIWSYNGQLENAKRSHQADLRFIVCYMLFGGFGFLVLAQCYGWPMLQVFGVCTALAGLFDLGETLVLIQALTGKASEFALCATAFAASLKFALLWPLVLALLSSLLLAVWYGVKKAFS